MGKAPQERAGVQQSPLACAVRNSTLGRLKAATATSQGLAVFIEHRRRNGGESGGESVRLSRLFVPEGVQVTSQLTRSVHDSRNLTHHRDPSTAFVQCSQQGNRVEPNSIVGRYRAGAPVRVVVAQAGCLPTRGHLNKPPNRVLEQCHGIRPLDLAPHFTTSIPLTITKPYEVPSDL
jgi:hypothetical protein